MKQVEIKGSKSHLTRSTTSKPHISAQLLPRFHFLLPKKHIAKLRGRPHHKRISPSTVETQHHSNQESNPCSKTLTSIDLQSQSAVSQIQFCKGLDLELVAEKTDLLACSGGHQGIDSNQNVKVQAGDSLPYISSISQHLIREEARHPMPAFSHDQHSAQEQRMNYLHLIFSFSMRYNFKVETIFLAFNIYHRITFSSEFQRYSNCLRAVASLFLAAKYQEIAIPKVQYFTRFDPSHKLSTLQILRLQSEILIHLDFNLSFPTVLQFIDIIRLHHNLDRSTRDKLVNICYSSLRSLLLWQGRGSLLALACVHLMHPELELGQSKSEELNAEMEWRVAELLRLGAAEWI